MQLKNLCFSILLLTVLGLPSFATWSIIVVDPKTKKIGIAGASCTPSVYGIGAIMPGKGAIVVQANGNPLARLQGFRMIMDGATPAVYSKNSEVRTSILNINNTLSSAWMILAIL